MKKVEQKRWKFNYVICLLGFIFFSNVMSAQESKKGDYSLGIYGGIGNSINAYRTTDYKDYSFFSMPFQYSVGLNLNIYTTDNQRIRIGADYGEMYYGVTWPVDYQIDESKVTMYNIGARLNYDYELYKSSKFQVFASPGLVGQFVLGTQVRSTREDGSYTYSTFKYLPDDKFQTANVGFDASVVCKYSISKSFDVSLIPNYDIFFIKFDSKNSAPYMRFGGLLEFDYNF